MRAMAAWFAIVVGISVVAVWAMPFFTEGIPELKTEPIRIVMHLAAEGVTAVALIVGGTGLLRRRGWGIRVYIFALGMLLYTLIQSPGYYAEQGEVAFVGMFAVLAILALIFIRWAFRDREMPGM